MLDGVGTWRFLWRYVAQICCPTKIYLWFIKLHPKGLSLFYLKNWKPAPHYVSVTCNLCRWPWRCIIGVITETHTTHQMIHSLSWHQLCRYISSVFLGQSSVEPFSLMDHCWERMDGSLSLAWCLAFHPFLSVHPSSTLAICCGAVATVLYKYMYVETEKAKSILNL